MSDGQTLHVTIEIAHGDAGALLHKILSSKYKVPFSMLARLERKCGFFLQESGRGAGASASLCNKLDSKTSGDSGKPKGKSRMGTRISLKHKVSAGEIVRIPGQLAAAIALQSEEAPRKIEPSSVAVQQFTELFIHEEDGFFVINKPAGLAVQGGNGVVRCVDAYAKAIDPEYRLVHRLDAGTTGCLIVAKNRASATKLGEGFRLQEIDKFYLAICRGTARFKYRRLARDLSKEAKYLPDGSSEDAVTAVTHIRTLRQYDGFFLLLVKPETGRKHQIRVHLAFEGIPIIGESRYARRSKSTAGDYKVKYPLLHSLYIRYKGQAFTAEPSGMFCKFAPALEAASLAEPWLLRNSLEGEDTTDS